MTTDEAYTALGLETGATTAEVKVAYHELVQMLHPDKYGDNKRLRERAEQQMRVINEARDVLIGKSSARRSRGSAASYAAPTEPESIAFEAATRARAAEAARIAVVTQLRTANERRSGVGTLAAISLVAALICSRFRGTVGGLGFSVASMLAVWGIVDFVSLSNQIGVLKKRSLELLKTRDRATEIAREAQEL